MAFPAVAMTPADFKAWLAEHGEPSAGLDRASAGASVFQARRCGDCHRINGTAAQGTSGPDLSHLGSRLTLGAGLLENNTDTIARFITHSSSLKPGSKMPAYVDLSATELSELAAWLKEMK